MNHIKRIKCETHRLEKWSTWLKSSEARLDKNPDALIIKKIEKTIEADKYFAFLQRLVETQCKFMKARAKNASSIREHVGKIEKVTNNIENEGNVSGVMERCQVIIEKNGIQVQDKNTGTDDEELTQLLKLFDESALKPDDAATEEPLDECKAVNGKKAFSTLRESRKKVKSLEIVETIECDKDDLTPRNEKQNEASEKTPLRKVESVKQAAPSKKKKSKRESKKQVEVKVKANASTITLTPQKLSQPEFLEVVSNQPPSPIEKKADEIPKSNVSTKTVALAQTQRKGRGAGDRSVFICSVCNVDAQSMKNFVQHIAQHGDQANHQCPLCKRVFKCVNTFRFHLTNHTSSRPFQCRFCNKAFVLKSKCQMHLEKQHPDELIRCEGIGEKTMLVRPINLE